MCEFGGCKSQNSSKMSELLTSIEAKIFIVVEMIVPQNSFSVLPIGYFDDFILEIRIAILQQPYAS